MAMNIGILGTGIVGRTLASRLVAAGHTVRLGSRTADNTNAVEWVTQAGDNASNGTFTDAAEFGEAVINATSGAFSVDVVRSVGTHLTGKAVLDVTNPLIHGDDGVSLSVANTNSLGEQLQRAVPEAHIVKTLNTMNCDVMANPNRVPGPHDVFIAGNNVDAKQKAAEILGYLGWPADWIIDLGDITAARGMEAYVLLWVRARMKFGDSNFNLRLVRP
jgi:8-hydroxy-5-deazaflavin:NADPH oxidoreductase